jgi:hypothetical protein
MEYWVLINHYSTTPPLHHSIRVLHHYVPLSNSFAITIR